MGGVGAVKGRKWRQPYLKNIKNKIKICICIFTFLYVNTHTHIHAYTHVHKSIAMIMAHGTLHLHYTFFCFMTKNGFINFILFHVENKKVKTTRFSCQPLSLS